MNALLWFDFDGILGNKVSSNGVNPLNITNEQYLRIYSQTIIKHLASRILHIESKDICLIRQPFGKPYIVGYPNFHFNLSHANNAIVAAISDAVVGVDVEKVHVINPKLAERFFTPAEQRYVNSERIGAERRFFELWTQKEAYVKMIGKGFTIPIRSFDVTNNEIKKNLQTDEKEGNIISICSEVVSTGKKFELLDGNCFLEL